MTRLLHIAKQGTITNNPLSSGATTINSAEFAALPVVSGGNTLDIVLDPNGIGGTPEVMTITAHSSAATSVTVTREQYTAIGGGAARSHAQGVKWVHAMLPADLDHGELEGLADDDHTQYLNAARHAAIDHAAIADFAKGVVAYAEITADVNNQPSAITDVAGLSVTFTAEAGRRYKVTFDVQKIEHGLPLLREGSTTLKQWSFCRAVGGSDFAIFAGTATHVVTPSAGSHTYKISTFGYASGLPDVIASAAAPAFIMVEDIGPS